MGHYEVELMVAAGEGNVDLARDLLHRGATVDWNDPSTGWSPLHKAVYGEHADVTEILLQAGANVDIRTTKTDTTPLWLAANKGHLKIATLLIKARANVNLQNNEGSSPLLRAAQNGHAEIVSLLVRANSKLDLQDNTGTSALWRAAQNGHSEAVAKLIRAGANVNLTNNNGSAPLHIACRNGRGDIVGKFIRAGAKVNLRDNDGATPLWMALLYGDRSIVKRLIKAGADVNLKSVNGASPLSIASLRGNCDMLKLLLCKGANVALKDKDGHTAFGNACHFSCENVMKILIWHCEQNSIDPCQLLPEYFQAVDFVWGPRFIAQGTMPSLSSRLHSALLRAGFQAKRADFQAAAAEVLQTLSRNSIGNSKVFIVGSYAEGWGSNLACLDGSIGIGSDIDMTAFRKSHGIFHLKYFCHCWNPPRAQVLMYQNGHVECSGFNSSPAQPYPGSTVRPAVDIVTAYECCCYPDIPVLNRRTNIRPSVLKKLRSDLEFTRCHLVRAAPPGQQGKVLRVSTTFLEKRLLRSLTTRQGRLFVVLKYLVKHKLQARGLKTYHVKTLIFRMLDETSEENWQQLGLVDLAKQALGRLKRDLQDRNSDPRQCMWHFFLENAALYLKKDCSPKGKIIRAVQEIMNNLPELLTEFMDNLTPVDESAMSFHPLLILPDIRVSGRLAGQFMGPHELHGHVMKLLEILSEPDEIADLSSLLDVIPNWARTARQCLKALYFLKLRSENKAREVVRQSLSNPVTRGLKCSSEASAATEFEVMRQLRNSDTVWKFSWVFVKRSELAFLPEFIRRNFPMQLMSDQSQCWYMNFDALLKCLAMELLDDSAMKIRWCQEVLARRECDFQDLVMALHYCKDASVQLRLIHTHRKTISSDWKILTMVQDLFKNSQRLRDESLKATSD